eukprot:CAMPEP_0174927296 /NCGR_PEP_ID=MMETSP1355-20121228/18059_1 /TAXON_ID=464990 /ORGANISM="Hemiselmis tepida, Strain CCMP443" /LENGTH=197 /DNA_ID=CAMNT_0016173389 /DNA_START=29 /DNA_END=618 /DNA_ORIENTATION=-
MAVGVVLGTLEGGAPCVVTRPRNHANRRRLALRAGAAAVALCVGVVCAALVSQGGNLGSLTPVEVWVRSVPTAYHPSVFRAGRATWNWGTRPHGDYSEKDEYTPDVAVRHHWGTRGTHSDYADQVYGDAYAPDSRWGYHYGTRKHRDYGEGDVFGRYEPWSLRYSIHPPVQGVSEGPGKGAWRAYATGPHQQIVPMP